MATIHAGVEAKRGQSIPDWAYRDVLFMLIDYSIRSFEVLERKLTEAEKQEVFGVFYKVGNRMGVKGLPVTFEQWRLMRQEHLQQNLAHSHYTDDLFKQYRKHLGTVRYKILTEAQILVVPARVIELMQFRKFSLLNPLLGLYQISRKLGMDGLLKALILPAKYKAEIRELDVAI